MLRLWREDAHQWCARQRWREALLNVRDRLSKSKATWKHLHLARRGNVAKSVPGKKAAHPVAAADAFELCRAREYSKLEASAAFKQIAALEAFLR